MAIGTITEVTARPAALGRQRLQHRFERLAGAHELKLGRLLAGALGRQHRQHRDAIKIKVGFRPVGIAHLGIAGQERAVQDSLRFAGANGTPGPGAVTTITGEFEFNPAGHGEQR